MTNKPPATLALNIIAGANDGDLLNRLLSSFDCRNFFDEIVIVCTTKDQRVNEVAAKYTDKVFQRPWTSERYPYGDFGGARQQALDNTVSDYVMWLDCDDLVKVKKDYATTFSSLRFALTRFAGFDFFTMRYVTDKTADGLDLTAVVRERIWKRSSCARWEHPCHEQLVFSDHHRHAPLTGAHIEHNPVKAAGESINRNLKILEHEYRNYRTRHAMYYYARDLVVAGRFEEAVPMLCEIVQLFDGDTQYLYESCMDLAKIYLYDKQHEGSLSRIKHETVDIAERYLRIAIETCSANAEPYVYLGDLWQAKNKIDESVLAYKTAMGKDYGNGSIQQAAYYEPLPAMRLAKIFADRGELEQAIWYNKLATDHFKTDIGLKQDRIDLAKKHCDICIQAIAA